MLPAIAPAQGSGAGSGVEMFNQCAEVSNDAERLACFDRVTRQMRAAPRADGTAAATTARPLTPEQSARQEREDFGLNQQRVREQRAQPQPVQEITSRVAAARVVGPGYWTFLLEDGAIWQMSELVSSFRPPNAGQTVRVRRGVMGGFLLDTRGQASVRVKRIS